MMSIRSFFFYIPGGILGGILPLSKAYPVTEKYELFKFFVVISGVPKYVSDFEGYV